MTSLKKENISQGVFDLYDDYAHNRIDRRQFVVKLSVYAVGGITVSALMGFISLAPDALTPLGGYPGNDDDGRAMQRQRDRMEMLEDFIAAWVYLKDHPECNGKIGVVGFCFGGWVSNMMAVRIPELKAAVPFYGGQPEQSDVEKIQTPLMLHFAELDKRVNAGWPAYEEALKKHGKEYTAHFYPKTNLYKAKNHQSNHPIIRMSEYPIIRKSAPKKKHPNLGCSYIWCLF